jgi:uncharacterized membrane protein YkoI
MKLTCILTLSAAALMAASPAFAQDATHGKTVSAVAKTNSKGQIKGGAVKKENLKSLAKISKDSARIVALGRVATGSKVKSSALEREKGTIVYSFDIRVPGQTGVEEILVSAIDGSVVSQAHETPKMEKAEAAKDKKAAAKKKG